MTIRRALTADAALASHRLVGRIFWDPTDIANDAALGVPDGMVEPFASVFLDRIDR